jgi:hypothetical protein
VTAAGRRLAELPLAATCRCRARPGSRLGLRAAGLYSRTGLTRLEQRCLGSLPSSAHLVFLPRQLLVATVCPGQQAVGAGILTRCWAASPQGAGQLDFGT